MTTRASTARGQDKQQFQGRVRKWRKQWDTAGDSAKHKLLKWVPTDERTEDHAYPRFPQLQPIVSAAAQQPQAGPYPLLAGAVVGLQAGIIKGPPASQSTPVELPQLPNATSNMTAYSSVPPPGEALEPDSAVDAELRTQHASQSQVMDMTSNAV